MFWNPVVTDSNFKEYIFLSLIESATYYYHYYFIALVENQYDILKQCSSEIYSNNKNSDVKTCIFMHSTY